MGPEVGGREGRSGIIKNAGHLRTEPEERLARSERVRKKGLLTQGW